MTLLAACLITFLSTLPVSMRESLGSDISFESLMVAAFFAWVFIAPLAFYVVALVFWGGLWVFLSIPSHQVRAVIFQAFFNTAPILLIFGIVRGYLGTGTPSLMIGAVWAGTLFWHLGLGLREAYQHG